MELPIEIQKYIYEFSRPISRPDWKKGAPHCFAFKLSIEMTSFQNNSTCSCCDLYLLHFNYIRYFNFEFYSSNYHFWCDNFLFITGFNVFD